MTPAIEAAIRAFVESNRDAETRRLAVLLHGGRIRGADAGGVARTK
jgi:hypothetical protein